MREIVVLENKTLSLVHHTALRVLEKTGIGVRHKEVLQLLEEHGALVDREQQRAWLPETLIDRVLSTVPSSFTLLGSDAAHDVPLGGNRPCHGRPVVGADAMVKPGGSHHHPTTLADVEDWVRLVEQLPYIHLNGSPYPSDVAAHVRDLVVIEKVLKLSRKPMLLSHYSAAALRWSLELMNLLPRREDGRAQRRLLLFVSCNSPLVFTRPQLDILLAAGRHQIPVALNTAPLAGATGPYTVAGMAAQMTAELLAGVVIAQLATPGALLIWSPLPLVFDMRTSGAASGYAEMGLLLAAFVQLARFYGLPAHSLGLLTDAVLPDNQAGQEKIQAVYASLLARPHLVGGAGGLASYNVGSMEQLILDNDTLGGLFHTLNGSEVNEETLAAEVIDQVGPGGDYLGERHTLHHLRREYYFARTANRLAPEVWAQAGGQDARARASEQVRRLLGEPVEPVVPDEVSRELGRVIECAQEALAP